MAKKALQQCFGKLQEDIKRNKYTIKGNENKTTFSNAK